MKTDQPKESANKRSAGGIWLKSAIVALVALLLVALPRMFRAHAGAQPRAPIGTLFTVTTTDDHNDFSCDGSDCTLREAIDAANNTATADTIGFSVTGTINLTSALPDIDDDVTINGPGAKALAVKRDGSISEAFRIFNVTTTGTVTFFGLTISNGIVTGNGGGGIQNFSTGTLNVTNCTISDNSGFNGGGGIRNNGTLNLTNSTISDNGTRGFGGGIFNFTFATVNVTNSTISGNFAKEGAGICNFLGTVNVTNSTISDNQAAGLVVGSAGIGGGIRNFTSGTVTVVNSTISDNSADFGGGISNAAGPVSVTNSTISGNRALGSSTLGGLGGGLLNINGILDVKNCTINDNSASAGGGINNFSTFSGTVHVANSTISHNDASAGGGIQNSSTGRLNVSNSTISENSSAGFSDGGGGIDNEGGGLVNVKSSIIAVNSAAGSGPDVLGVFTSIGFNLIGKADGSTGFTAPTDLTGTVASPLNPRLDPNGLQDNGGPTETIALLCDSPVIDKGTGDGLTGFLATDQRGTGFPRTTDDSLIPNAAVGDGTDIGAFELPTCNHPPMVRCRNIQLSAGNNCQASITPAQIDNGSFDPDPGDSIATRTLDNSGPFGLGPHTVILTVTDTHGASNSCTATVTVVDTTPPTITCPTNIFTRTAGPANPTVAVNYSPPSASDNCSPPTVVCSPPSGSQFPLGTTTVTCLATDAANNMAPCSFTVTVFDVCVQDDTKRDTMLFNSQTGEYLFVKCGGGFSLSGRGIARVMGGVITLEHNASDRRLMARIDNSQKKGTASVQTFTPSATCTITDRNTADSTCACP